MIELLPIRVLVHTAGALVCIARPAEYVGAASCRKAGALMDEAEAWCDARAAAYRAREAAGKLAGSKG